MIGNNLNGLKRVMKETIRRYKVQCLLVFLLILVSAIANVYGSVFLQTLIDDYITPLTIMSEPDFGPLAKAILYLACIYGLGIVSTYTWNRLMINISLGTLNDTRESLFKHMESLPIAYFDTHAHGDIMSVYTNDTPLGQVFPRAANDAGRSERLHRGNDGRQQSHQGVHPRTAVDRRL